MFRRRIILAALTALAPILPAAAAEGSYWDRNSRQSQNWSVSLWLGPNARKFVGAIVQDGFNMQSRGLVAGVALNRKLVRLGSDIYIAAEIQVNQTFLDHQDTIFAGMLGLQFDNLFGYERTSFAVYTGPSYDLDPAYEVICYKHQVSATLRKKFLNEVTAEFSSGLPFTENWDWAARLYHRSGVFGLYSQGDDDGLGVGLGLRYHF